MAQIVDVRSSGGSLVILGGALGLPTYTPNSSPSIALVEIGSIRYNTLTSNLEIYTLSGWTNKVSPSLSLSSSDVTTALGYTPISSSVSLSYSQIPASLVDLPFVYSNPGLQPVNQRVWYIPVVIPFTLPLTFTGSVAVARVPATTNSSFTLSYIRNGVSATIGTIMFAASAVTGSFAGSVAYTAVVGDILILTSPTVQDATLSDVGIVVIGHRTS